MISFNELCWRVEVAWQEIRSRWATTHGLDRPWKHEMWKPDEGGINVRTMWFSMFTPYVHSGDFIIFEHPDGGTTRYRVIEYGQGWGVHDQHFATLRFAPRVKDWRKFLS